MEDFIISFVCGAIGGTAVWYFWIKPRQDKE